MLKIINPVNTYMYRQPLSKKMKRKSKIGLFVMFALRILGIISKYKHFCNKHAIQNTGSHMYGIPFYEKT